jgi:prevent-host-death family protein
MRKTGKIAAATFKRNCLELLDEVAVTGRELIVTKRGKPIARIMPVTMPVSLLRSVLRERDLLSPIDEPWDAEK